MYNLYLDHTDYYYEEESSPDTIIFAGVLINQEYEKDLKSIFETSVSRYTSDTQNPIKWNFKDLNEYYRNNERETDYRILLENMNSIRKEIFYFSKDIDYNIIYSCNRIKREEKKGYSLAKEETIKYSFSNTLMRIGLEMKKRHSACKVFCDWPNGNNKKPYESEYTDAFKYGKSSNGIKYFSGPLKSLGFDSSVYFTSTTSSRNLQFVDLLLGSFSLGFKNILKNKKTHSSVKFVESYFDNILNSKNYKLLPHGISVSSSDLKLKRDIQKFTSIVDNKRVKFGQNIGII